MYMWALLPRMLALGNSTLANGSRNGKLIRMKSLGRLISRLTSSRQEMSSSIRKGKQNRSSSSLQTWPKVLNQSLKLYKASRSRFKTH